MYSIDYSSSYKGGGYDLHLLIKEILANIFLIKSFVPYDSIYFSLNGVSWYLSVCVFLYFAFPYLKRLVYLFSVKKAVISILVAYLLQIMTAALAIIFVPKYLVYITYVCPLYRMLDFFAGCNLFIIYKGSRHKFSSVIYSVLEIVALFITVISTIFLIQCGEFNLIIKVFKCTTILFLPVSLLLIYLFAIKKGFITKVCTNKVMIYLGNISPWAFLIHYVVIKYIYAVYDHFSLNLPEIYTALYAFVTTIICVQIWMMIQKIWNRLKMIKRNHEYSTRKIKV